LARELFSGSSCLEQHLLQLLMMLPFLLLVLLLFCRCVIKLGSRT